MEEERLAIKRQIAEEIQNNLIPIFGKLAKPDGTINQTCYNILGNGLQLLASQSAFGGIESKLSPREIEICNLIKEDADSKEICRRLAISPGTVGVNWD